MHLDFLPYPAISHQQLEKKKSFIFSWKKALKENVLGRGLSPLGSWWFHLQQLLSSLELTVLAP